MPHKWPDYRPHITVSGAGGTFDVEFEIIKRALELAGIKVEIRNDHPHPPNSNPLTLDQLARRKDGEGVVLIAEHQPWGG